MVIPSSLDVFAEETRQIVEEIGRSFTDPDSDWLATLVLEVEGGQKFAFGLVPELFAGDMRKDMLAALMAKMMTDYKVERFAFVMSAWSIRFPKEMSEEEVMRASREWSGHFDEHPDREERLLIQVADREQEFTYFAMIERHEDGPPTLSKWTRVNSVEGRFAVMRDVLQGRIQGEDDGD